MLRKTTFGLCLLLLSSVSLHAQTTAKAAAADEKLVWLEWNEGYEKAVKDNKILLVDAYTDWCGWCKRMDRDTYTQGAVIKKINSHFVPVKFNPEIQGKTYNIGDQKFSPGELYGLLTQGNSTGFPTTYYIFPAKKQIMLDAGYKGPQDFLNVLDRVIEQDKQQ